MQEGESLTSGSSGPEPETLESKASVAVPIKPRHNLLWFWVVGVGVLLLAIIAIVIFGLKHRSKQPANNQTTIKTQNVDTKNLSPAASSFSVTDNKVVINGELQANQDLVLTPTDQPQTPVTGSVYLDKNTKELRYFNGTKYITLASQDLVAQLQSSLVTSSNPTVESLQGASGALTLLGSGGLTITANGTNININLPQNLTATASPIFNNIALSSLNCTGNQNGGKLTTDASGNVVCSDDNASPPGAGITSLNGQIGTSQTFANDTNVTITSVGNVHTLGWSGTLSVARGGTNIGTAPTNGQLLIGNGSGYTLSTITQGAGISIAPGAGTISIASTLGTSVDLTTEVTGTLPVGNGCTGATTFTQYGVVYGNGANTLQVTAAAGSNLCLLGNTGAAPT
ncbi:MAG: hypothetical protein ACREGC_02305, partial [Minisyncoccia bacterium]